LTYTPADDYDTLDTSGLVMYATNPLDVYKSMYSVTEDGSVYTPLPNYLEHQTSEVYSHTIRHVLLPVGNGQIDHVSDNPANYRLVLNGGTDIPADYYTSYKGYYGIVWENVNISNVNRRPLFAFRSLAHTSDFGFDYYWYEVGCGQAGAGSSRQHVSYSHFANDQIDGIELYPSSYKLAVKWWVDSDTIEETDAAEEDIPDIETYDIIFDSANNSYAEFHPVVDNYYSVGDTPWIIYNLTGDSGNNTLYWIYIIKEGPGSSYSIVHQQYISFVGDYTRLKTQFAYSFESSGRYHLKVYNATNWGQDIGSLQYKSSTISVQVEGSSEIDDPGDTDTGYLDDIGAGEHKGLIGFGLAIIIGGALAYISMSGVLGAMGFGGSMLFFAIPNTGLVFFPPVVLFIMGLICILLVMYFFIGRG